MSRKNRERRRLRQEHKVQPAPGPERGEHAEFLNNFDKPAAVPEPATWPGAADPVLSRPDLVKSELAKFAIDTEPGHSRCRQLERDLAAGLLAGFFQDLKEWARE